MRVLVLTQYFPPEAGGPQVRLGAMCRELADRGHEVEVVTAMPNYPEGEIRSEYKGKLYVRDTYEGIPVHRLWLYTSKGAGIKRVINFLSFAATSLIGLFKSQRPDYIFTSSPPLFLGIPSVLASKVWGVPLIFNVADLWPDSARHLDLITNEFLLGLGEALEHWIYRDSDFVCAVTEGIRDTLKQEKRVNEEKLLFLPNGVDTETFSPRSYDQSLAEDLGVEDKWTILYAGTHGYAHGLDVALDTAGRLGSEDIHFLLVGGGSEKDRLVRRADEMDLSNLTFLDPVSPETVGQLYSIADAGLSTLRDSPLFEGTRPAKVLAAMSTGTPVLYSGHGEGARMVRDVGAGTVTPPQDAEALADAIKYLRQNPKEAGEMGSRGREFVMEHYSWKVLVGEWLEQLNRKTQEG
ncbi:glycosyltransferase family 4 protein [Salinibacter ruber]|uniref:glycosyltransferase family 4 protein n=1 Tax=Salinibacter ruber TaxID=146919 RepID=UPI00216852E2|nr:glycosyltransferase family 4 protein [Salinibacter ruber]MCS3702317.1 glycosyltransferase involved in cell wall biosynthesis [Salinibacter ruber]